MDPFAVVVFVALILFFFVVPSVARLGRPFTLAISSALCGLGLFWASAFWGPIAMEHPRGLGAAIDIYIRVVATLYVLAACLAQLIRNRAEESPAYRHWLVVLLLAFVTPVIALPLV